MSRSIALIFLVVVCTAAAQPIFSSTATPATTLSPIAAAMNAATPNIRQAAPAIPLASYFAPPKHTPGPSCGDFRTCDKCHENNVCEWNAAAFSCIDRMVPLDSSRPIDCPIPVPISTDVKIFTEPDTIHSDHERVVGRATALSSDGGNYDIHHQAGVHVLSHPVLDTLPTPEDIAKHLEAVLSTGPETAHVPNVIVAPPIIPVDHLRTDAVSPVLFRLRKAIAHNRRELREALARAGFAAQANPAEAEKYQDLYHTLGHVQNRLTNLEVHVNNIQGQRYKKWFDENQSEVTMVPRGTFSYSMPSTTPGVTTTTAVTPVTLTTNFAGSPGAFVESKANPATTDKFVPPPATPTSALAASTPAALVEAKVTPKAQLVAVKVQPAAQQKGFVVASFIDEEERVHENGREEDKTTLLAPSFVNPTATAKAKTEEKTEVSPPIQVQQQAQPPVQPIAPAAIDMSKFKVTEDDKSNLIDFLLH